MLYKYKEFPDQKQQIVVQADDFSFSFSIKVSAKVLFHVSLG
jgi:hypothetical protein